MNAYLNAFSKQQYSHLVLAYHNAASSLSSQSCYNNSLFYKGFLLNAKQQVQSLIQSQSSAKAAYEELQASHKSLAAAYSKPIAQRTDLAALEEKASRLEKELAQKIVGIDDIMRQVDWKEVQQQLQPGEAALEFVHVSVYPSEKVKTTVYAALLLQADGQTPQFIPLFEEKQLQALLPKPQQAKDKQINRLYAFTEDAEPPQLAQLTWQALAEPLKEVKTLYFSTSGLLHRLNLSAISDGLESVLSDRIRFIQLGSTRQLIDRDKQKKFSASSLDAMLFGGIQYDATTMASPKLKSKVAKTSNRGIPSFASTDSILRINKWKYLDWTEVEVAGIEAILGEHQIKSNTKLGHQATEEAFKAIDKNAPRILHIATHGFFFPDPDIAKTRNVSQPIFQLSEHPMIRSGLIMAGGNHAWEKGVPQQEDMEDGILTAYEISQMDLSNTELVVLSACDTGLGDINGNEGVYGLQRAFKIAGAKNLIMSLWQVSDYHSQQLMTTFYSKWLDDELSITEAFRSAQQEMQQKYRDPFYWAGFILVE